MNQTQNHSPGLVAILARARDAEPERISVKTLEQATGYSNSTARRIFSNGWEEFDAVTRVIREFPEDVAREIAGEILGGRFTPSDPDCRVDGRNNLPDTIKLAQQSVSLAATTEAAESDGAYSIEEAADVLSKIAQMRKQIDAIETRVRRRMPRTATA